MASPDSRNDTTANPQSQAVNGHWIKMFKALWDHPKVASMCEILKCAEALLIGALFRLWSLADTHSTDGRLELSAFALNRKVGVSRPIQRRGRKPENHSPFRAEQSRC